MAYDDSPVSANRAGNCFSCRAVHKVGDPICFIKMENGKSAPICVNCKNGTGGSEAGKANQSAAGNADLSTLKRQVGELQDLVRDAYTRIERLEKTTPSTRQLTDTQAVLPKSKPIHSAGELDAIFENEDEIPF